MTIILFLSLSLSFSLFLFLSLQSYWFSFYRDSFLFYFNLH
jgi:hypothetical protein